MAEPTAQQLARQRIAKVDITKFAPKPPKKSGPVPKQKAPKPPRKPRVILTPEERKAKARQYNHDWYVAHKEHCLAQSKKWAQENRDKTRKSCRDYYAAHKDARNAASKKWREEHKDIYNARMREYRRKQMEKCRNGSEVNNDQRGSAETCRQWHEREDCIPQGRAPEFR